MELILVYTGAGKGKTTASVGQALRAIGSGLSVAFGQFMKRDNQAGEQKMLARLLGENFCALGSGFFRDEKERPVHRARALEVLAWASERNVDMLVLDEALYALGHGLIYRKEIEPFLGAARKTDAHLVLSGRNAPQWLLEIADTATEMGELTHARRKGVPPLRGMEY